MAREKKAPAVPRSTVLRVASTFAKLARARALSESRRLGRRVTVIEVTAMWATLHPWQSLPEGLR